ncbi:hypothetical protein ACS5PJ_13220 [Pseudarthrobacter sp. YS3]|uniref:hypothetical protein n=1 Tax=Pseudarthrobacter sp. YS3 TaxID=3453718 RepID=UPI003EE90FBC
MDRKLHALVTRDVLTDTVRIDIRGSLNEESRPSLVRLVERVRSMGIPSHILVDLSRAALVESAALAGLRNVLNSLDGAVAPANAGAGVSLVLSGTADGAFPAAGIGVESLFLADDPAPDPASGFAHGPAGATEADTQPPLDAVFGPPLSEYSDDELFAASDSLFALLDTPEAFGGSDLLARFNDIGEEISRRKLPSGLDGPASEACYDCAGEGQAAS